MLSQDQIKIRPAQQDDVNRLSVLSIQVWLDTYATLGISEVIAHYVIDECSPDNFLSKLQRPEESILVAEFDNNIVGFIELLDNSPCPKKPEKSLEIVKLYVMPRFHGYGIGSKLLETSTIVSQKKGYASLWLTTWHENFNAIQFYNHKGFKNLGVINVKIGNIDAPNIIFIKAL